MTALITEMVVILVLLMVNGALSMTEMAVVASRKATLRQLAAAGNAGAGVALGLAESPNRFLPTVQTGITLVGLLAGAIGGITIAEEIAAALKPLPGLANHAEAIGVGIVVVAVAYLSLIVGELVPKRLALANPESIASRMARPMAWLSRLMHPIIRLLGASTELVLRLLGAKPQKTQPIFDDEVRLLLQEGMTAGVFHEAEPRMVESVLSFDQRPVRDIMTPSAKLVFLDKAAAHEAIWHKIVVSGHSNFPVYEGGRDHAVGVVSVKSIYANVAAGVGAKLADLMTAPLLVPAAQTVTQLLERFKKTGQHIALVVEPSGVVVGLVTLVVVLEAIVGEMPTAEERLKPDARQRGDGSWLVDGRYELIRLEPLLGNVVFPGPPGQDADTLAGFVAVQLGREAQEGDSVSWQGVQLEVIDMDRQRIDKVLVVPLPRKT